MISNGEAKIKALQFPWPKLPGNKYTPVWNGRTFQIGDKSDSVLCFETGDSGWTDDLTSFHEDNAGSNHVMDRSSRAHALRQVKLHLNRNESGSIILEVGCSSGYMLQTLCENLPQCAIIGADYVVGPLKKLAERDLNIPLIQFDVTRCPLPDACVDAVVLLNVLEHVKDDVEALREIARILKPGGVAVIEVPAGPHLYDFYDKQLMHFRRYSMTQLMEMVKNVKMKIIDKSHLGFFIYPGFSYTKKRNRQLLDASLEDRQKLVSQSIRGSRNNFILNILMGIEMQLGKLISYPTGIRCLLTCKKPELER